MHILVDNAGLLLAQQAGVLSAEEAFRLEALAATDDAVPVDMEDAVERLFLWFMDSDQTVN